jgi:hypothetical protein
MWTIGVIQKWFYEYIVLYICQGIYVIFKNLFLKINDVIHVWLLRAAFGRAPAMMNKYSRLSNPLHATIFLMQQIMWMKNHEILWIIDVSLSKIKRVFS